MSKNPVEFVREVRAEVAKVTWPTRRETMITTSMVFIFVVIAALFFLVADKIIGLRIFPDEAGKMNRGLADAGGEALVVSQFTLYGDCQKGRRPSFVDAAPPEIAVPLYEEFLNAVRALGIRTASGRFGAMMQVELVNDGPVTMIVETP